MQQQPHEKIFNILFQEDELTWQNIIYDLVRREEMNPWDINISMIAQKFIERLKELKNMDFRISGKVVLASALLLKMKTNRLMDQDITAFDNLIAGNAEDEHLDLLEELAGQFSGEKPVHPALMPRTPQPRKRKVSVFDLVEALEKALEVQSRRKIYAAPQVEMVVPKKQTELTVVMKDIYDKVVSFFNKSNEKLTFEQLIPSNTKEDKVFTFIPLLHLDNQMKIILAQEQHFGDIFIHLNRKEAKIVQ